MAALVYRCEVVNQKENIMKLSKHEYWMDNPSQVELEYDKPNIHLNKRANLHEQ